MTGDAATYTERKAQAWRFFRGLHEHLNEAAPPPGAGAELLAGVVARAKSSSAERHSAFWEGAYLNQLVIRQLHEFLVAQANLSPEAARAALLSESHRHWPEHTSGSPARGGQHPFDKGLGTTVAAVLDRWRADTATRPLGGHFPDLALREPSPFSAIFEGKVFRTGQVRAAQTALVADLYQAFFYLGLARRPARAGRAAWDFEFSVLLAYDISPESAYLRAWGSLDPRVRAAMWEEADIYPMIYTGDALAEL
jgi:hypothetical protein